MFNLIKKLQKNLVLSIPTSMLLGFFYGLAFDVKSLKSLVIPLTFLMIYPMMINLDIKKIFEVNENKKDLKLYFVTTILNFLIIPLLTFILGKIFFSTNPVFILGIFMTGLVPTSGMTISWTGFSKGNINAAIKITVLGLILGSILMPVYLKVFMSQTVNIPFLKIFLQIIYIVFLPMILGIFTKKLLIKIYTLENYKNKIKDNVSSLSVIGVLGIVLIGVALKAKDIFENPKIVLIILPALIILYFLNFVIATFIGKMFFKKEDAIALVYSTVMRNLSIILAIAMISFKEMSSDISLIIAVAYIIQVQSAAWYVKLTDKIYK
jgi:ACR3 family arsenite efflux pump ArsB